MTHPAFSPSSDSPYVARQLGPSDVTAMVALQADIIGELPKENAHFIIPKLEARFAAFTSKPHIAFGAIAPNGDLAGIALVGVPNVLEPALGQSSGLVQSVFVQSKHRNQRLMDLLLQNIDEAARASGILTLSTRIAADNVASQRGFERNGYLHYGHGKRDLDGTPLNLLWKELMPSRPGARLRTQQRK